MRVLVTGANGYIGQGVVDRLIAKGVDVVATDIRSEYINKQAQIIETNFFDIEEPYSYFGKPDVVLHLAWRDGFKHGAASHLEDLPKHYDFLRKMAEAGTKEICVMGSMHEVGFYEGSIDENTPCNPQSLYGISKNALRESLFVLQKDYSFNLRWLRGFYIVGNSERGCSIFSKITEAVKQGKKEFPFTMGTNQYDFIDYELFCDQIATATIQNDINGIINCCSGNPTRLGERVEQFIMDNAYDINLQYGAFEDRPYDSKAVWGNDEKIRKIMEKQNELV